MAANHQAPANDDGVIPFDRHGCHAFSCRRRPRSSFRYVAVCTKQRPDPSSSPAGGTLRGRASAPRSTSVLAVAKLAAKAMPRSPRARSAPHGPLAGTAAAIAATKTPTHSPTAMVRRRVFDVAAHLGLPDNQAQDRKTSRGTLVRRGEPPSRRELSPASSRRPDVPPQTARRPSVLAPRLHRRPPRSGAATARAGRSAPARSRERTPTTTGAS